MAKKKLSSTIVTVHLYSKETMSMNNKVKLTVQSLNPGIFNDEAGWAWIPAMVFVDEAG